MCRERKNGEKKQESTVLVFKVKIVKTLPNNKTHIKTLKLLTYKS